MKKKLSRQRTSICLRVYEETNFAQFLRGRGGTKKAYERRQFRKSFLGEKLRPPNPGKRVKPSNLPTGIFPKVGGREMSFQEAKNPAKSLLRPSREGETLPSADFKRIVSKGLASLPPLPICLPCHTAAAAAEKEGNPQSTFTRK